MCFLFFNNYKLNFMSKKNVNANVKSNVETIKENKLTEINLAQFSDRLQNVELKVKKEKQSIYVYPESFTKEIINSDTGKKFRNKQRNTLQRFCDNILIYAKGNRIEELQKEIASFETFYKTFYRVNDYSIASLSNSEKKEQSLLLMIAIINEIKSK